VKVKVTVRGSEGELIEEGLAQLSSDGGEGRYTTPTGGPFGQTLSVTAVAEDNPGKNRDAVCTSVPMSLGAR
jgi:hypothetical protein